MSLHNQVPENQLQAYKVGDSDQRPWGHYIVTDVGTNAAGEEFCEKDITIKPQEVLSLQSHALRREHWSVTRGTLTVVLDDTVQTLTTGQDIKIPLGSLHCMANLAFEDCVVHEVQEGICREEDIIRYADAYGRDTEGPADGRVTASLALYRQTLALIRK